MRIVGGELRGRRLTTPPGDATRPTTDRNRESLFNILLHHDWGAAALEDGRVLDGFCGSGALAFEALSRGAASATLFDLSAPALTAARANVANLGLAERVTIRRADATRPPPAEAPATLILLDPPYGRDLATRALAALESRGWAATGAVAMVEEAENAPFTPPEAWVPTEIRQRRGTILRFLVRS